MTDSNGEKANPAEVSAQDACEQCADRGATALGFEIAMAFQPIVDVECSEIFAHEALVRTAEGGPAGEVFAKINDDNRYTFDQTCRRTAIRRACELDIDTRLSINFMPNAVYEPANCIRATVAAARKYGLPLSRIMFEVTESEQVRDHDHLKAIIDEYKDQGFLTAMDDFGAGYAGLNFLAAWQPDFVKLDMALTRDIHREPIRRRIVEGILDFNRDLGINTIAEGIETEDELLALRELGVTLMQGYYLARPAFDRLVGVEEIAWTEQGRSAGRRNAAKR